MSTGPSPAAPAPESLPIGFARGFFTGIGILGRGFRLWITSPKLMFIGTIPGLITLALFGGIVVALAFFVDDVAVWLTGFANDWDPGWLITLRIGVGVALFGAAGAILVVSFAAVALLIGQPFFEVISREVEAPLGGVPGEVEVPLWASIRRGILEALRMMLITGSIGIGLFLLGLVPVVGSVIAAVIGALTGGWFLALELSTVPFERRGLGLRERRAALRRERPVTLGFGVGVFLFFLIPLGGVLAMPVAVASATLLARRALGESIAVGVGATPAPGSALPSPIQPGTARNSNHSEGSCSTGM